MKTAAGAADALPLTCQGCELKAVLVLLIIELASHPCFHSLSWKHAWQQRLGLGSLFISFQLPFFETQHAQYKINVLSVLEYAE